MRAYRVVHVAASAYWVALSDPAAAVPKPSTGAPAATPGPAAPPNTPAPGPGTAPGAAPPVAPDTTPPPNDAAGTVPQDQPPETTIPTPTRREDTRRPPRPPPAGRGRALLDVEGEEDAEADAPSEVRKARDTLGSHLIIGASGGFFFPGGSLDDFTYQSDKIGPGFSIGADIGYGISRTVVLGVYGELSLPEDASCSSCGARSIAVGPFVRYHLVQGVRFDPWLSAGAGYRTSTFDSAAWTGIDVVRLALGGDFYPWPSLGFGPFAETAIGTYFDASPKLASHNVYANFILGLRVVFDAPGK